MQLFDTHVHYNLSPLLENWETHHQTALEKSISYANIVGADLENSRIAVELAQQHPQVWASIGVHPDVCEQVQPNFESWLNHVSFSLTQLISENKNKVIALGEMGLDYYWLKEENRATQLPFQQQLFTTQLELAITHQLPVVLHIRDKETPEEQTPENAYWDVWHILNQVYFPQVEKEKRRFILHCASGPLSFIKAAVKEGAFIGFDGNVTYPKAENLRAIFRLTPSEQQLLETDAPYLPPQPFRGKTCEPWMITETASFLATQEHANLEQIFKNSFRAFNLTELQIS